MRPNALIPLPYKELSVFRVSTWDENQIVEQGNSVADERESNEKARCASLGQEYPSDRVTFRNLGRGELLAKNVRECGLNVTPDEPPTLHANIIGWPQLTANKKEDEAAQLRYALKLAGYVSFIPAPE